MYIYIYVCISRVNPNPARVLVVYRPSVFVVVSCPACLGRVNPSLPLGLNLRIDRYG